MKEIINVNLEGQNIVVYEDGDTNSSRWNKIILKDSKYIDKCYVKHTIR